MYYIIYTKNKSSCHAINKNKDRQDKILQRRLIELLKLNKSADVHLVFTSIRGSHFNNLTQYLLKLFHLALLIDCCRWESQQLVAQEIRIPPYVGWI